MRRVVYTKQEAEQLISEGWILEFQVGDFILSLVFPWIDPVFDDLANR